MKKPGFALRFLTLVTYFLPFVFYMSTCVGDEYRTAYNKKEALQNESDAFNEKVKRLGDQAEELKNTIYESEYPEGVKHAKIDSFRKEIPIQLESTLSTGENGSIGENVGQKLLWFIVSPTYYSISGIGSLFLYKNLTGRILIGLSLLLTLVSLLLWKFFKRKKIGVLIIGTNIGANIAVALVSLLNNIELLPGFWLLLILLTVQLISGMREKRKTPASKSAE